MAAPISEAFHLGLKVRPVRRALLGRRANEDCGGLRAFLGPLVRLDLKGRKAHKVPRELLVHKDLQARKGRRDPRGLLVRKARPARRARKAFLVQLDHKAHRARPGRKARLDHKVPRDQLGLGS